MAFSFKSLASLSLAVAGSLALSIPASVDSSGLVGRQDYDVDRAKKFCDQDCNTAHSWSACMSSKRHSCALLVEAAQCTTPAITDAEVGPKERWDSVYAGPMWDNFTRWYKEERETTTLPFPRWISNKLHGRENMDCQSLSDNNGCTAVHQCDDVKYPAGYLLLNSFVTLNNLMWNFYDSMYNAKSDIESSLPAFASTFSPMSSDGIPTAIILDIIGLGFVTAAAPIWNGVTRVLPAMRDPKLGGMDFNGLLKDTVNGIVTQGLTLAKDLTRTEAKLAAENDLTVRLGTVIEIWAQSASEFSKNIFSGETSEIYRLSALIGDGKLSATPFTDHGVSGHEQGDLSAESIKQHAKKALYADLIPRAWSLSNKPLGPFILKTNTHCGGESIDRISDSSRDKYGVCINGEMWVLTSAPEPDKKCRYYGDTYSCLDDFYDLPGANKLDGKAWGGLTVEDIVRGSVATWDMHGHANKGKLSIEDPAIVEAMEKISDPSSDFDDSGSFFEKARNDGIRAGGVINLPVCDLWEAIDNWERGFGTLNFKPGPNYPCND